MRSCCDARAGARCVPRYKRARGAGGHAAQRAACCDVCARVACARVALYAAQCGSAACSAACA
eukprot:479778-Lingulodinium_polyedra.AAC.1